MWVEDNTSATRPSAPSPQRGPAQPHPLMPKKKKKKSRKIPSPRSQVPSPNPSPAPTPSGGSRSGSIHPAVTSVWAFGGVCEPLMMYAGRRPPLAPLRGASTDCAPTYNQAPSVLPCLTSSAGCFISPICSCHRPCCNSSWSTRLNKALSSKCDIRSEKCMFP